MVKINNKKVLRMVRLMQLVIGKSWYRPIKGDCQKGGVAMKTMKLFSMMLAGTTSAAFAAATTQGEGAGILAYLFVGFFALIIITQLAPAMVLFFGMMKGLFSRQEKTDATSVRID
jgi:hypothetical protein